VRESYVINISYRRPYRERGNGSGGPVERLYGLYTNFLFSYRFNQESVSTKEINDGQHRTARDRRCGLHHGPMGNARYCNHGARQKQIGPSMLVAFLVTCAMGIALLIIIQP